MLGQSWFDILHPEDLTKVKEQLLSPDVGSHEKHFDMKNERKPNVIIFSGFGSTAFVGAAHFNFFLLLHSLLTARNLVKADSLQSLSGLCVGARRSFFCRMKCKSTVPPKQSISDTTTAIPSNSSRRTKKSNSDKKYIVFHCTGYLKSWAPAKMGLKDQKTDCNGYSCNLSCLVAIGRILPDIMHPNVMTPSNGGSNLRKIHFLSRHTVDGKFSFIDQR